MSALRTVGRELPVPDRWEHGQITYQHRKYLTDDEIAQLNPDLLPEKWKDDGVLMP